MHASIKKLMVDEVDIAAYLENTEGQARLRSPGNWIDDAIKTLYAPDHERGAYLPWSTMNQVRLRGGDVTIWSGYNETRKSFITSQVALSCADQGEPAVIASFEMRPVDTVIRMVRQWTLKVQPTPEMFHQFGRWAEGRIWIYNQMGQCNLKKVLAVSRYAADVLKAKQVVIDSMMRVVEKTDDYSGQKAVIDRLLDIAQQYNIHCHIVAHNKKPSDHEKQSRYSIKGASEISDLAPNIICVERPENEDGSKPDGEPDARLIVMKHRGVNWKGSANLYLAGQTGAFFDNKHGVEPDFGVLREQVVPTQAL